MKPTKGGYRGGESVLKLLFVRLRRTILLFAMGSPFSALTALWGMFTLAWLPTSLNLSYSNTSDLGFHLYNLKQFSETGFSFYNSQWFMGQEYLTVYSPGTAMLGSLFSWLLPGISGALLAYALLVSIGTLVAMYGAGILARTLGGKAPAIIATGILYALTPFLWRGLMHSLPDFIGYALLPCVLAYWIAISDCVKESNAPQQSSLLRVNLHTVGFATLMALLSLVSAIVALHAVVCILMYTTVRAWQNKRSPWQAMKKLALCGAIVTGLTAFWLFPFLTTLLDPNYGGDKLSLAGGSYAATYIQSIAQRVSVATLRGDIIALVSPLSRHRFPLLLGILALLIAAPVFANAAYRKRYAPILAILVIGILLAVSSAIGAIASVGLGLLLEHGRWFDIVQLALAVIAGAALGISIESWPQQRPTRTRWLRTSASILVLLLAVTAGVTLALSPPTTISVRETNARLAPLYTQLQEDAPGERLAEFPFLAFVPGNLEHKRPMLFGSCMACNRNEKIALMQAFEPVQAWGLAGTEPKKLERIVQSQNIARTLSERGVRSILIINTRSYPDLGLVIDIPLSTIVQAAAAESTITLVASTAQESRVDTWIITPRSGSIVNNTIALPRQGIAGLLCGPLGLIGTAVAPARITCTASTLDIDPGVPLAAVRLANRRDALVLPRTVSPVADSMLDMAGPLRTLTPLVQITRGSTRVITSDMLYRVRAVEPMVTGPVNLTRPSHTEFRGIVDTFSVKNATVRIREGFAPGWKVTIGSETVQVRSENGFLAFTLPPSAKPGDQISLRYQGPASRRFGWAVFWVTVALLVVWISLAGSKSSSSLASYTPNKLVKKSTKPSKRS